MTLLVALYISWFNPPSDAQVHAFRATAPSYLTDETARENLTVAIAAGVVHHVRPELLLSIAHHESRYIPATRTPEVGNRESCGIMTPTPKSKCIASDLTMIGGYDLGAEHLAVWFHHCNGREVCALLAYAGGGTLARTCTKTAQSSSSTCNVASEFLSVAHMIGRAIGTTSDPQAFLDR